MAEYGIPAEIEVTIRGDRFLGRPLAASVLAKIQRKHTRFVAVPGSPLPAEVRDFTAIGRDVFVDTVSDWMGPTRNGEPWPCTAEARAQLAEEHSDVAAEVLAAIDAERDRLREAKRGK